jgi:hypothetical protein
MPLTPDEMRRITYSRYLLERAKNLQAHQTDLSSAEAILAAHDAAEMLMRVVCEYLNITPEDRFMGFWKVVKNHGHQEPPLKSAMDSLNNQRNEFKHRGRLSHAKSVEGLLFTVVEFCERISRDYLGIDYNNATLTALIQSPSARTSFDEAETKYRAGDVKDAMGSLRKAFGAVYEDALKKYGEDLPEHMSWSEPTFRTGHHEIDHPVKNLIDSLNLRSIVEHVNDLTETMNMQILGVDALMFRKFVRLTPHMLRRGFGHEPFLVWQQGGTPTPEDYEFCRSFIINFALQNGV